MSIFIVLLGLRTDSVLWVAGIGRIDIVESRFVGMKSRGCYETPGGTVLYHAHRAMEALTLDRGELHLKDELGPKYSELVYNGFWFAPEREALQKMIDSTQVRQSLCVDTILYCSCNGMCYPVCSGGR